MHVNTVYGNMVYGNTVYCNMVYGNTVYGNMVYGNMVYMCLHHSLSIRSTYHVVVHALEPAIYWGGV